MTVVKRFNNAFGTTTDSPLSSTATTMNSNELPRLGVVDSANNEIARLTLDPERNDGAPEIVHVTSYDGSATSATIERGKEGTTAREHASGTTWEHALTSEDADNFAPLTHEARHRPGSGTDALFISVADEASLPAASTQGRLAIARNGDGIYYDDGTSWINLGGGSAMEVIATAGPTNLADTGTLQVSFAAVVDFHELYLEVRGENASDSTQDRILLDGALNVALLRNGTWITAPSSEQMLYLGTEAVGTEVASTFPLSLASGASVSDNPSVTVNANHAIDNVQLRLLGVRNP